MEKLVSEWVQWLIIAALVVLVIMHPEAFVRAVAQVGTTTNSLLQTLSGSNYGKQAA